MNVEKKYKQHIEDNITPDDNYDKIAAKLDFANKTPNKEKVMKKKSVVILTAGVCGALVIGVSTALILRNVNKNSNAATSMVTMDVNPSIRFVLDKNNKVLSVSGENDEGKMIISNEEIVGKDIEEAVKVVLTVENETGYLVSGNFSADSNKISFSISVDDAKIRDAIQKDITTTVNKVCEDLNIKQTLAYVDAKTKDEIEAIAMKCDSTLTAEQADKMTYSELFDVIKLYSLETAEIYSVQLEQLYNQTKECEIKLADAQFTKEVISGIGTVEQSFKDSLQVAINEINNAVEYINQVRYEKLVSADSDYQKKLAEIRTKKQELIEKKNELANKEDITEMGKEVMELAITGYETALKTYEQALANYESLANASIDVAIATLNTVSEKIQTIKDSMPNKEEVEKTLNEKAKELDAKLNEAKANAFKEFEKAHAEDIQAAKEQVANYKKSLKDSVAAAKAK